MLRVRPVSRAGILALVVLLAPQAVQAQDAKAEVKMAVEEFEQAFNAGDVQTLTSFYTDGSVVMPANAEAVKGLEAIHELWAGMGEDQVVMDFQIQDLTVSGDLVIETSTYVMDASDGSHIDHGKYLVVWKKTDEGWKMIRDIWNSDMAAN